MTQDKLSRAAAEKLERENIAYYAGYCSNETRLQVERLFRCDHTILRSATNGDEWAGRLEKLLDVAMEAVTQGDADTALMALQEGIDSAPTALKDGIDVAEDVKTK